MPLNRTQVAQLVLLFLALPAQYILSEWWGSNTEPMRTRAVNQMIRSTKENVASIKSWVKSLFNYLGKGLMFKLDLKSFKASKLKKAAAESGKGESIAKEVFLYNDRNGYFAQSAKVRSPRSKQIKYRVGQVIKHKKYNYRGVIVGWDDTCNAPKTWMDVMHQGDTDIIKTPHYAVLVDKRDRNDIQTTYVAQENIEIVTNVEVRHPNLWDYFDFYDGAQYHMRSAMHGMYPHD